MGAIKMSKISAAAAESAFLCGQRLAGRLSVGQGGYGISILHCLLRLPAFNAGTFAVFFAEMLGGVAAFPVLLYFTASVLSLALKIALKKPLRFLQGLPSMKIKKTGVPKILKNTPMPTGSSV